MPLDDDQDPPGLPGPPQPLRWLARRTARLLAPDLRSVLDHLDRALADLDELGPQADTDALDRARTEVTLAARLVRGD